MKRNLFLLLFVSVFSFSNFLEGIKEIDKFMQQNNYESAYEVGKNLLNENLSDDDREVVLSIIGEIEKKLPNSAETEIIKKEENLSDKPKVSVSPIIAQANKNKFKEYEDYEKKVLATNNSQIINDFSKFYIRMGLFESAMKLALKDPNREKENIYLAATVARMIGEYDKSIKLYEEVLAKDIDSYKSYLGLAINYKIKGDYYRAVRNLRKYANYDNSPEIQKEIKKLEALE